MKPILPAVLGLAAMTCACASGPRGGPPSGEARSGEGPPMAVQVFVSPFGQPFEAGPAEPYPVAAWFAGADADHDGRLTLSEFEADGAVWFETLDRDRDGRIGPAEVAAYETMIGERLSGFRGPRGGPNGPMGGGRGPRRDGGRGAALNDQVGGQGQDLPGGGMPGNGGSGSRLGGADGGPPRGPAGARRVATPLAMANLLAVPQPVKAADADVNQFITSEEWTRAAQRWFGLLDRDHDGALTLAELPQTGLQQHGGRRPR